MTPAKQAKMAGIKSLQELAELTGQSKSTLWYWTKNSPELFEAALKLAVNKKERLQ